MNLLPARQPRGIDDSQLIPLINVVFLMLIFFMVAGQLAPTEVLKIEPPVSQQALAPADKGIQLALANDGNLTLDQHVVGLQSLSERLRSYPAGTALALKVDALTSAAQLDPVLAAVRSAGIEKLTLLTRRGSR